MSGTASGQFLSWEDLIYIADFLQASGQRHVSLLGGEPTIHKDCTDYILYLLERGFGVTVFTNGLLGSTRLKEFEKHLTEAGTDKLNFVCNVNDPEHVDASPGETGKVHGFLSLMGPWTTAGFNIHRLDFNLDFVFRLINRHGLKRHLRIGIAHPIPGRTNAFIDPKDIGRVIDRIYGYRRQFDTFRVRPGLDCGFPICECSDEQLGWLHRFGGPTHFRCGPAFDISPDMSVYFCFPLSNYQRKSLFEFDSVAQIDRHFRVLRDQIKAEIPGIFDECDACRFQEDGVCTGGGLCQVLRRFMDEAPVRLPEIENELSKARLSE